MLACVFAAKLGSKIVIFFLYAVSTMALINLVQIIVKHIRVKFTKVPPE